MKVVLFGSTGMVGQGVLRECLRDPEVTEVLAVTRSATGQFMDARGIARAAIVGHSMGSLVAQQVAIAWPERVTRLVLVASGTGVRHLPDLRTSVRALRDPVPVEFVREFQLSTISHPVSVRRDSRAISRDFLERDPDRERSGRRAESGSNRER